MGKTCNSDVTDLILSGGENVEIGVGLRDYPSSKVCPVTDKQTR